MLDIAHHASGLHGIDARRPSSASSSSTLMEHILWNQDKSDPCLDLPPIKRRLVFSSTGSEIKRKLVFSAHKIIKARPTKRELEREAQRQKEEQREEQHDGSSSSCMKQPQTKSTTYVPKPTWRRKRQLAFDDI
ncbi:Aste57867_22845 [Aphanomyces stellatus]|uniref:Aste57867_22845 protein n=1 Tax=Aphanomyces stellatus TaxID=120398 RepID=A0A485LLP0_9STRA|nr:hypothetical protein As57867_022774 [Aphanomyces stellatus]VFT99496.1 Aste57867_22845 [Aphanomyces stellatus]